MFVLYIILYNLLNAFWHSRLIKKQRKIYHGWWSLLYVVFVLLLLVFGASFSITVFSVLVRKPVFDISLNLFRGLKYNYVDRDPESLVDDIFYSLFGRNQLIPLAILLGFAILSLIFIS